MIMTGSKAALMRDCLPSWREGQSDDYDFHAKPRDINRLEHFLKLRGYGVIRANKPYGVGLRVKDLGQIDILDWKLSDDMIAALDDNLDTSFLGIPTKVISETTQYVLKKAYQNLDIWPEKTDQDLAYWEPKVLPLSPQHEALLEQVRSEINDLAIFRERQS